MKELVAQSCPTHFDSIDPSSLLCPWVFPGKNTGVFCCSPVQGIFPTQGSNPVLSHCMHILYHLKEIQPVHPKGDQSWIFIGRTDAEAEAPILWPPDGKCWLIEKDPDAGKDWRQEEKGTTEDETVGWHHWLNGRESEQTLGDSGGQGNLAFLQSVESQRVRHNLAIKHQQ